MPILIDTVPVDLNPTRKGARGVTPRPLRERVEEKIERTDSGCWQWVGTTDPNGYGRLWTGSRVDGTRRASLAHRLSYRIFVGEIPEGLVLDHLCRNTGCVNPEHLEPVTSGENLLRGDAPSALNRHKTHCPKGHAYDEANTKWYRGKRYCRSCRGDRMLEVVA